MTPSDGIDRRLDSFLDGDLTDAEMGEFRQALMEDEALRVSVREDLMLSAALEQAGAGAFGERAPAAEAVRAGSHRRLRWSAAAALLVAAFVLGRSMDSGDGAVSPTGVTQVDVVVAEAGDLVVADGSTTREVRVGEARIRVRPGARARVVSTVPPVLTLEQGGLEVESAAPTDVRIAGFGKATTSGSAALLFAAATDRREPYLMVTSFSGDVRVVDGEFTDRVTVGEPRLFDGGGPRLTGDVLARLAELEGDEGLLVLTTAEHAELLSSFDDDKQSLQVRVAELMAERERLEVELAAIKRRTPNQERASLTELVRTTAELAEKEGLDGRDRARWWRRIRAVRRAGRRPGEIVAVIDRELLQPTASTTRPKRFLYRQN